MPSTLPQSISGITSAPAADPSNSTHPDGAEQKPRYVISSSGHAAHPDDIMASCRALRAHVAKLQAEAEAELRALDERIKARELAEKRRVAPGGWIAMPEFWSRRGRSTGPLGGPEHSSDVSNIFYGDGPGVVSEMAVPDEGEELDRAFGSLALQRP